MISSPPSFLPRRVIWSFLLSPIQHIQRSISAERLCVCVCVCACVCLYWRERVRAGMCACEGAEVLSQQWSVSGLYLSYIHTDI